MDGHIEVVGPDIRSGKDFLAQVTAGQADVLLLDINMPAFDVYMALDQLRAGGLKPRVLILSGEASRIRIQGTAKRGAFGYALKSDAVSKDLPDMIRAIASGRKWYSPSAGEHLGIREDDPLTPKQQEILLLMAQLKTPEQIAAQLCVVVSTIHKQQYLIREKLGATTNTQALLISNQKGLIVFSEP